MGLQKLSTKKVKNLKMKNFKRGFLYIIMEQPLP